MFYILFLGFTCRTIPEGNREVDSSCPNVNIPFCAYNLTRNLYINRLVLNFVN